MLKNSDMKAGRFARFAKARKALRFVQEHVEAGRVVTFTNYLVQIRITKAEQVALLKATKSGLYIQRRGGWECLDGCKLNAFSK